MGSVETRLQIAYQYRELGNDLKTTALWPKNRWQTVSLSLNWQW